MLLIFLCLNMPQVKRKRVSVHQMSNNPADSACDVYSNHTNHPNSDFSLLEHWKKGIIINTFSVLIRTFIIWKWQIDPLFYRTFVIKINRPGPLPFIFQHKPFRLPFIIDSPTIIQTFQFNSKINLRRREKKNTNPFSVFSSWNTKLHRKLTINLVFKYIYIHTHPHTQTLFYYVL